MRKLDRRCKRAIFALPDRFTHPTRLPIPFGTGASGGWPRRGAAAWPSPPRVDRGLPRPRLRDLRLVLERLAAGGVDWYDIDQDAINDVFNPRRGAARNSLGRGAQRFRPRLTTRSILEPPGTTRPGRRLWEMTVPFFLWRENAWRIFPVRQ